MEKLLDVECEKAIKMAARYMHGHPEKSPLFHDMRVGIYLYEKEYSRDVVIAGFLHDVFEHGEAKEEEIKKEFGERVLELIKSVSKDYSIKDSWQRVEEMTKRASAAGKDAMIIRAADTIDSFKHYTKTKNESQLDYCRKNAEEIFKNMEEGTNDPIFEELKKWINI